MFKHVARCPVCKAVIDEIVTPTEELSGMTESWILGERLFKVKGSQQ